MKMAAGNSQGNKVFVRLTTGKEKGDASLISVINSEFEGLYPTFRGGLCLNCKAANRLAANYLHRLLY